MFGSWQLSLAAYNVGPGRITRRVAPGDARSFADLVTNGALPAETRNYVSQFLAAVRIVAAPEQHGFLHSDERRLEYDLVRVRRSLAFRTIADLAGVSVAEVADLNPALLQNMTPPDRRGYLVRLPKGTRASFDVAYAQREDDGRAAPARLSALRFAASRDERRGEAHDRCTDPAAGFGAEASADRAERFMLSSR